MWWRMRLENWTNCRIPAFILIIIASVSTLSLEWLSQKRNYVTPSNPCIINVSSSLTGGHTTKVGHHLFIRAKTDISSSLLIRYYHLVLNLISTFSRPVFKSYNWYKAIEARQHITEWHHMQSSTIVLSCFTLTAQKDDILDA